MKALVTGADGFVGPHLVKELISNGYEVVATHKSKTSLKFPGAVQQYSLDILDRKNVEEICLKARPDAVFHLAGISDVKFSIANPDMTMKVNVDGTKNITEAAEQINATVLFVGSAEEYGIPKFVPISEEHPLIPVTPYAKSKVAAEKLAIESAEKGNKIVIVRSFNHTGPGQSGNFVCSAFAKSIAEIEKGKEPIMLVGNLDSKRDFTDVRDIVKAYALAIRKCKYGVPYNICSGKPYQIRELLEKLLKLSNVEIEVKIDKSRMRKSDIPILLGDNGKFCAQTGWKTTIKIEKTLADILGYWRKSI